MNWNNRNFITAFSANSKLKKSSNLWTNLVQLLLRYPNFPSFFSVIRLGADSFFLEGLVSVKFNGNRIISVKIFLYTYLKSRAFCRMLLENWQLYFFDESERGKLVKWQGVSSLLLNQSQLRHKCWECIRELTCVHTVNKFEGIPVTFAVIDIYSDTVCSLQTTKVVNS